MKGLNWKFIFEVALGVALGIGLVGAVYLLMALLLAVWTTAPK